MAENSNHRPVVDLGSIPRQIPEAELPQIGVQVRALARRLSPSGTYKAGSAVRLPDGSIRAGSARESYMDAEQLIEAIGDTVRGIMRAELRAFAVRIGKPEANAPRRWQLVNRNEGEGVDLSTVLGIYDISKPPPDMGPNTEWVLLEE